MENKNPSTDIGQEIISKLKELNSQLDELLNAFQGLKDARE